MGLAYNLNVEALKSITDWGYILNRGDMELWKEIDSDRKGQSSTKPAGDIYIPQSTDPDFSEFDIIIRNTTYCQDHYIVVGSYRAFFSDLNGGAGAWAWDGFITIIRAHNLGFVNAFYFVEAGEEPPRFSDKYWLNPGNDGDGTFTNQPFDRQNQYWTYLCRMPYECDPGLTGISSDSTPGVYGVDSSKRVNEGLLLFNLVVGGHSRINTAVEGGLTGQDYSAWFSTLQFGITSPEIQLSETLPPNTVKQYGIYFIRNESTTVSINGSTNIGTGLPSQLCAPARKQDISSICKSSNTSTVTFTQVDITTLNNGYYPTRVHDVSCLNVAPIPYQTDINYAVFTGEVAYGDGAGSVSITTPFFSGWDFLRESGSANGLMTFALGNLNWMIDASVPAYNLNGAYGTAITPSFSQGDGTQDTAQLQVLLAVDRVTHGASTNGEIYAANYFYVFDSLKYS